MVRVHGIYSADYAGSWLQLADGKRQCIALGLHSEPLTATAGSKTAYVGQSSVTITGLRLRVSWAGAYNKYNNACFVIQNCYSVVIEDCVIEFADSDARASSAFIIEGCGEVTIRNVRVAGACHDPQVRTEGCSSVFVDRLECCGLSYAGGAPVGGAGLLVNNGTGWNAGTSKPDSDYSPSYYRAGPKWALVQNSWFHDHNHALANEDAVLAESPYDGAILNCVFERWQADAAVDASHRRGDADYGTARKFRIERCRFYDCLHAKSPGANANGHEIMWCNNVLVDTPWTHYPTSGDPIWHVHESSYFSAAATATHPQEFTSPDVATGQMDVRWRNCAILSDKVFGYIGGQASGSLAAITATEVSTDHVYYALAAGLPSGNWFEDRRPVGGTDIANYAAWQAAGYDAHSTLDTTTPIASLVDIATLEPVSGSALLAAGEGGYTVEAADRMAVWRDWWGYRRSATAPSIGAYEYAR